MLVVQDLVRFLYIHLPRVAHAIDSYHNVFGSHTPTQSPKTHLQTRDASNLWVKPQQQLQFK